MRYTVALAGNPNSGKTTLFNALTGLNQYVGNWPGVTVERREALARIDSDEATIVDLPGVYSLSPYSIEERITDGFLREESPGVILNVVDATNLARNLYLTTQLLDTGIPVVLALNMMDALRARGGRVDCGALSRALGASVVPVSAKRREGFDPLFAAVHEAARGERAAPSRDADEAERYARAEAALQAAGYAPGEEKGYEADRVLLGRWAYPAFFALLAVLFFLTFGPIGSALSGAAAQCVELFARNPALAALDALGSPEWVRSLTIEGVIGGVGGVISFLPQILLLFLCLSVLEDSGYMARAAFLTDRLLRALGLSGRSFIPMLMGFGCTTTAVVGARTVENERDRRMTVLLTPLMSCGAKIPVYSLVAAAAFPGGAAFVILGLYALGMALLYPVGLMLRKFVFREGETPFVMELPPYRAPTARGVSLRLRDRAKEFLVRAGTVIFAMSVLIWFLQSFTPGLTFAADGAESIFGLLGGAIAPVLAPLGFGDWQSGVSLLSGLVAKEAVVSGMQAVYGAEDLSALGAILARRLSGARALSFLSFVLVYPPCASAMAAMRRELGGWKWVAASAFLQTALAWLVAFVVYRAALFLC